MAKRHTEILFPGSLTETYDKVRRAVLRQGWLVTGGTPPGQRFRPDIRLRAGSARIGGSGFTRIVFLEGGSKQETRVSISTRLALGDHRAAAPALSLAEGLLADPKEAGLGPEASPLPGRTERMGVRLLVGFVVIAAVLACALTPIPKTLPAPAFDQAGLYRLEVVLVVFYGGLLLLTPAFAGMIRGRLPTEISTRGAKFADEVRQERAEISDEVIQEQTNERIKLELELAVAKKEIKKLAKLTGVDPKELEDHESDKSGKPLAASGKVRGRRNT